MDRAKREMTFEEEAKFYEDEARAEFAKETGNGDCSDVNGILRRGMRIIRKAREEIANREVRHGEWNVTEHRQHLDVECSNCKSSFYVYKQGQYRIDRSNYCPNCGAKMDGKGEGE